MNQHQIELWATALTFLGSALLAWKELSPVAHVYFELGKAKLERLKNRGSSVQMPSSASLLMDEAKRFQWLTRPGFLLMTVGFLLDFLAKWRAFHSP
jgi:hypothetical protein